MVCPAMAFIGLLCGLGACGILEGFFGAGQSGGDGHPLMAILAMRVTFTQGM